VESPTGIIPEELMYPQRKAEVIAFLMAQPLPSWTKRRLAEGWCITVGCRMRSREYHLIEVSGTDQTVPLGG
jgi:hypothetical protein